MSLHGTPAPLHGAPAPGGTPVPTGGTAEASPAPQRLVPATPHVPPPRRVAPPPLRFVALGDSLTAGFGDPVPGGGWRGWAALLADGLVARPGGVELVNVARSGALTADVAGSQLAAARRVRSGLASVVAGANDTLRAAFDIRRVADAFDVAIGSLTADGAVVLTACLPDPGRMLGLPAPLARPLRRRMEAVNTVVHVLSRRYGAVHVHLADHPWTARRAAWSVDRLHPSELGHRLLAREFHGALVARGLATGAPPAACPEGPPPSRAAAARWMATRGTRWIADRCTDLLPALLGLAVRESRHLFLGTDRLLDLRARSATRAALADLARRRHAHTDSPKPATDTPGAAPFPPGPYPPGPYPPGAAPLPSDPYTPDLAPLPSGPGTPDLDPPPPGPCTPDAAPPPPRPDTPYATPPPPRPDTPYAAPPRPRPDAPDPAPPPPRPGAPHATPPQPHPDTPDPAPPPPPPATPGAATMTG
ncbi:SGNH/GDSL hydrolase family protein [Streptomyces sp. XD-27]|uniref:SGNH/GDSL hydrolase family protein n=1 Tax=Streptomyces sp. XD-27 TaxID=3062779 RepID=UPI00350E4A5E